MSIESRKCQKRRGNVENIKKISRIICKKDVKRQKWSKICQKYMLKIPIF